MRTLLRKKKKKVKYTIYVWYQPQDVGGFRAETIVIAVIGVFTIIHTRYIPTCNE